MTASTAARSVTRAGMMLLAVGVPSSRCFAGPTGYEGFLAQRRAAVAHMQAGYDKIASHHAGRPQMRAYQDRLTALNQLVRVLCDRTESAMSDSLDDILGTPSPAMPAARRRRARTKVTTTAVAVLNQYQQRFAGPLPLPHVPANERELLRRYYDTSFETAEAYVADRCKVFGALDANHAQAVELALVLHLLRVSDAGWAAERVGTLPKWLRSDGDLKVCEQFALRVKRPRTAYALSCCRSAAADQNKQNTFLQYASSRAEALTKTKDYAGAMAILNEGIGQADKDGNADAETDLRLRLGDLLDLMGHPALAADEARQVWTKAGTSGKAGRSAVLRLKWLYKAEQFQQVMAEAGKYRSDKRCAPYQPQIIYISWVAHRRENRTEKAAKLQDLFLGKFPKHPLGADMHFASAMSALAGGDYPEALRRLEIVRYRYPKSRLVARAKDITEHIGRSKLIGSKGKTLEE